jgi:Uma2 family endonuclease
MRPKVRATRADYERMPEEVKAELLEGELVVTPTPTDWHETLVARLMVALHGHLGKAAADRLRGSRTEVIAREKGLEHILQPDVAVLPEGTKPTGRDWKAPTPVWVAEVLSPSTAARDRGVKLRLYAASGVREAWLVDPDTETIEVHDLAARERRVFAAGERETSVALSGFAVDALFAV